MLGRKHLKWNLPHGCLCWLLVLHSCSSNELNYNNQIFFNSTTTVSVLDREKTEGGGQQRKWKERKEVSRKHLDSQVNSSSVLKGLFRCCSHSNQLTAPLQALTLKFEKQICGKTNPSTSFVNVYPSNLQDVQLPGWWQNKNWCSEKRL